MILLNNSKKLIGYFINGKKHSAIEILSVEERLSILQDYAKNHEEYHVVSYMKTLFPSVLDMQVPASRDMEIPVVAHLALPENAPSTWKDDKQPGETPPDFIKRVYGAWVGKGLTRAHIRTLDKPLWQALYNFLRTNEMPADVDLPTRAENTTRWVERLETAGAVDETLREAARLRSALYRRKDTDNQTKAR
jgi:hypothetical protein